MHYDCKGVTPYWLVLWLLVVEMIPRVQPPLVPHQVPLRFSNVSLLDTPPWKDTSTARLLLLLSGQRRQTANPFSSPKSTY